MKTTKGMTKKLFGLLLTLVMVVSMFPAVAGAAEKDDIPSKVRVYNNCNEYAIQIELADTDQSIDNIKTDSKNLFAMLTGSDLSINQTSVDEDPEKNNSYTIGLICKKNGTYTVSFDIVDKDKNKVSTKEIKVYVYDSPIKSITMNGKQLKDNELTGKSAKVKVTLNSGNTIKKLEYGVYKIQEDGERKSSEKVYKEFKNGASITFGTKAYYYSYGYSYVGDTYSQVYQYFNTSFSCPTFVKVTYYDKYTKRNETFEQYYFKYME